jgi:hypothetical protein
MTVSSGFVSHGLERIPIDNVAIVVVVVVKKWSSELAFFHILLTILDVLP